MGMDLQIHSYVYGLIDGHLWASTSRQTLIGMDLQIDTYDHGLIDRHLWAWTYRHTIMCMDLQIDTYGHGLGLGLGLGHRQTLKGMYIDRHMGMDIDRQLFAFTYRQTVMGIDLQIDIYDHLLKD